MTIRNLASLLFVAAMTLIPASALLAAQPPNPAIVQQVINALSKAESDPQGGLDDLARLLGRVRADRDKAFVMTERGALLIQQDQMPLARAEMAEVLEGQDPDFAPRLRNLYATTLLTAEEFEAALEQLQWWDAHTENPHPHGLFLIGYACIRLERFEDAVHALERAVQSDYPTRDPWVELLAYAYTQMDRPEEAVTLLEGLLAEHPDRQRWWKQLAGILMLLDDLPEGTASMAVAQAVEPLSDADLRRLARLFAHLGMPADGAALLTAAMEARTEPQDYEALMLLGELWMLARETDRAIEIYTSAQQLADQGEAALIIGQLHAQREEYELARTALEVSVAAYGEGAPARAYYLLAVVQINLGELAEAADTIERLQADEEYRDRAASLTTYIRGVRSQS